MRTSMPMHVKVNEPGTSWNGDDDTPDALLDTYDAGYNDGK